MYVTNILKFDICLNKSLIGEKYLFSSGKINGFDVSRHPSFAGCHLAPDDSQSTKIKLQDIYTGVGLFKFQHDNTCFIKVFNGVGRDIVCSQYYNFPYMKKTVIQLCGYSLSLFLHCLSTSESYVDLVSNHLSQAKHSYHINKSECMCTRFSVLKINVIDPEKHVIDLKW